MKLLMNFNKKEETKIKYKNERKMNQNNLHHYANIVKGLP